MQVSLDRHRVRARALLVVAGVALLAAGAAPRRATNAVSGTPMGRALREQAQKSDLAMQLVTSLTSEIGPRPAGSPALLHAADWAVAEMKRLGLENVHAEPVTVPHWVRGE